MRPSVRWRAAAGAALVVGLGLAAMGPAQTAAEKQPQPPAPTPAPTLQGLAFLRGTWAGLMEGDPVEETWSAPSGDSIIGMFRWQSGGKTTMWELLAIKAEPDGPALRLRHFSPDLTPWKGECDAIPVLKATTLDPTRVVFTNASDVGGLASCEYDCTTPDTLAITVSFKPQTNRPPLKFQLQRVKG